MKISISNSVVLGDVTCTNSIVDKRNVSLVTEKKSALSGVDRLVDLQAIQNVLNGEVV